MLLYVGRALLAAGRLEEAAASFCEILRVEPQHAAALSALGDVSVATRKPEHALSYHLQALALQPNNATYALACVFDHLTAEQYGAARDIFYDRRMAIRPHWGHGAHYLGLAPEWDGRTTLSGKTILVHGAVGLGDTIQYCRFLPLLKEQGAHVILEVPVSLRRLMEVGADADQVISKFEPLPALDFEVDARELFLLSRIEPWQLARWNPYLFQGKLNCGRLRFPLDATTALRVGLVWAGGGSLRHGPLRRRSVPFGEFRVILDFFERRTSNPKVSPGRASLDAPECDFISLQAGLHRSDLQSAACCSSIFDAMGEVTDFLDTTSIISQLDVIVTIDTSVAHLATAMGKRTIILLPYDASWRWGGRDSSSIWSPTARLFRQQQPGNWHAPITRVGLALRDLMANPSF